MTAVPVAHLAGHHEVTRPQLGGQAAARARHRQGGERLLAQRVRPGGRPARPVPGRHDPARAWPDPNWLAPAWLAPAWLAPAWLAPAWLAPAWLALRSPRRTALASSRSGAQTRSPVPVSRAAPDPWGAHLEPGHGRAARYRPSALTGKTSRYRW